MRTVGEILKSAREKASLSYSDIEQSIKIRADNLELLEKNDFSKIRGGGIIARGFIKNYAEFLGLSAKDSLAIFRRDFQEAETGEIVPRGMVKPFKTPKFAWTPKLTAGFGLVFVFLLLAGYLFYQYFLFLASPRLSLSSPGNGALEKQSVVMVVGKTDPDASLFIDKKIKSVDEDGSFKEEVVLSPGENEIVIEAVSRKGKTSKIVRQVRYEP